MKKIYSFFVAAMFATASFAQQATATFTEEAVSEIITGKYYLLHKTGAGNGGAHYLYNNLAGEGILASNDRTDELKYVWKATKDENGKVTFQNVGTGAYMASFLTAVGGGNGGVLLKTTLQESAAVKADIVANGTTFNFSEDRPADADVAVYAQEKYYLNCNQGAATVWYTSGGNSDYSLYEVTFDGEVKSVALTINETYNGTQEISTKGTSSYAVGHTITLPTGVAPIGLVRNVLFDGAEVSGETFSVATAGTLSFNFAKDFTNLPFTPSTFDDLKWHNITIRNTKVWTLEGEEVHAMEGADTAADAAQWAIVESDNLATKGWYIVNKSMPDKVIVLTPNENNGISEATAAVLVDRDAAGDKQWSIQASGDKHVFRFLNEKTLNAYLNDHANRGILKTWVDAGALNDPGSQVTFTAVETTSIQGAKVADEVETVYFDLNGRKVSKLVSGKVYITNKGVKVLVK